MLPVIALVGQPNVGKSTLFNRLTKSSNALVSDFPGLTRDRQYGEGKIAERSFIVIDTGGITNNGDEVAALTSNQALQAIEDADLVMLVVDARLGVTSQDQKNADQIRIFGKKICLVVNKTEGLDTDLALLDFYQLGFGKPYAISAAHGEGVSELIETVLPLTEGQIDTTSLEESIVKLAIIGRPNVGKSTLTNRMLKRERVIVYDEPGTTRDSIFIPLTRNDKEYILIDTAGIRKKGKVFAAIEKFSVVKTLQAIQSSNVVLFIIDGTEGVTDQDLRLLGFILDCGKALVVAINKWDGMDLEAREHTKKTIDRRLRFLNFARIQYISALHGSGVGNLFDFVDEAFNSANKKLPTPLLTKILEKAIFGHNPPLVKGRRIKLRYAHAGGHNPPVIVIHGNQVSSLPDSYKRYLENFYQEELKLIGTPVRIELKKGENPFHQKKKKLSPRQQQKKKRLIKFVKKKKK